METVRRFCELSAIYLGWQSASDNSIGIIWEGKGTEEVGKRADTGAVVIRIDPRYYRPTEVNELLGDSTKAKNNLGWEPKISLEEMISEMIIEDKKLALKESNL